MIHEYYKELQNNQNIRENLSLLRSECKDPQARETLLSLVGDGALLTGLLAVSYTHLTLPTIRLV